ncbi:MAG: 2-oxoglutarate oxidoreductase [Armatimonadetes bacterium]|nr:2-oxoglutarate oxidoreductase [Armatimonadota bacterium]
MKQTGEIDVSVDEAIYARPASLTDTPMRYCPGCTHGIAHRLVAEVMDELGVRERTVCIASVGCSVYAYEYFNCDCVQAAHGRAPAVATGVKRVRPDSVVFTYQGDGDLASIGLAEVVHAAARGENITVIFINNAVFGMTQGQMAPTTLPGQVTTTTPRGRSRDEGGFPLRVCELLQAVEGVAYLARFSLSSPRNVIQARRGIKAAFEAQLGGAGFSLVELLSTCPVWWRKTPIDALKHIDEQMTHYFPLGVFVDWRAKERPEN